jgi:hypothetical protein
LGLLWIFQLLVLRLLRWRWSPVQLRLRMVRRMWILLLLLLLKVLWGWVQ